MHRRNNVIILREIDGYPTMSTLYIRPVLFYSKTINEVVIVQVIYQVI